MHISVDHVTFSYPSGFTALTDISLEIAPGEVMAIIGENGAGKTTLVRHLNGLLKPSAGAVTIGEWDTRQQPVAALARRVGYVFQNPDDQLFERTVRAEVAFGPRNLGRPDAEVKTAVEEALARVGLLDSADRHPYDLHVSQRKLVALAASLAMDTPIVILDEPTTGQDARGVELIGQIVEGLRHEGRSVITITHDIDFCAEHFPRVVVMAQGRILADGPARTVLAEMETLARAEVEPPQMVRLAAGLGLTGGRRGKWRTGRAGRSIQAAEVRLHMQDASYHPVPRSFERFRAELAAEAAHGVLEADGRPVTLLEIILVLDQPDVQIALGVARKIAKDAALVDDIDHRQVNLVTPLRRRFFQRELT
jgi:energy-coupling factor transport system ATP-binding protein